MADLAFTPPEPHPLATSSLALIEAKCIGQKIRTLRLKRSMGLVELGRRAGLSPSFLSQLENGRVVPTIRNLAQIALVFEKDMSHFFTDEKHDFFRTSRAKDRIRLPLAGKKNPFLVAESLSALIPDQSLVPSVAEFLPGATDGAFDPQLFKGIECVYVIRGSLMVLIDEEEQRLDEADILWADGGVKRQYKCCGNVTATALIVGFPGHPARFTEVKRAAPPSSRLSKTRTLRKTSRATRTMPGEPNSLHVHPHQRDDLDVEI